VEVVDDGDAAQVEQVLAGAQVAGAAALSVPDVRQGVLDLDAFAQLRAPVRGVLAATQFGQQRLVGMDGHAAPVAAGGAPGPQRARGAGAGGEAHGPAGLERHGYPGGAGQLPGSEVEAFAFQLAAAAGQPSRLRPGPGVPARARRPAVAGHRLGQPPVQLPLRSGRA
jgi:hypothetical protein